MQLNTIACGDARELAASIPDNSVDLIFTDPVYERIEDYAWLAQEAARILKPDSAALMWSSIRYLPETIAAIAPWLNWRWQLIEYRTNEVKHRPAAGGKCVYAPLLWFDKGKHRPRFVLDVRAISVFAGSSNHVWSKPPLTIGYYLAAFTKPGDVVVDFFAGGGTVPVVCKELGRNFYASEIKPETAAMAQARLDATQEPLPGMDVAEQYEMFGEAA